MLVQTERSPERDAVLTLSAYATKRAVGLPDPLILSFYFSLRGDQITQLIIVHNKTEV
jgi:hypothetical protein